MVRHEVPFDLAAETGTRKVICEHSTIGIVVTTDGSVSDIPREGYARTEKRIVEELDALGKPYIILLNSTHRMPRRRSSWPRAWHGTTTTPCCR